MLKASSQHDTCGSQYLLTILNGVILVFILSSRVYSFCRKGNSICFSMMISEETLWKFVRWLRKSRDIIWTEEKYHVSPFTVWINQVVAVLKSLHGPRKSFVFSFTFPFITARNCTVCRESKHNLPSLPYLKEATCLSRTKLRKSVYRCSQGPCYTVKMMIIFCRW